MVTDEELQQLQARIAMLRQKISALRGGLRDFAAANIQMRTGTSAADLQAEARGQASMDATALLRGGAPVASSTAAQPPMIPQGPTMQATPPGQGIGEQTLRAQPTEEPGMARRAIDYLTEGAPMTGDPMVDALRFQLNMGRAPFQIARGMAEGVGTGLKGLFKGAEIPGVKRERTPEDVEAIRAGGQAITEFAPVYGDVKDVADVIEAVKREGTGWLFKNPGIPVAVAASLIPGIPGPKGMLGDTDVNVRPDLDVTKPETLPGFTRPTVTQPPVGFPERIAEPGKTMAERGVAGHVEAILDAQGPKTIRDLVAKPTRVNGREISGPEMGRTISDMIERGVIEKFDENIGGRIETRVRIPAQEAGIAPQAKPLPANEIAGVGKMVEEKQPWEMTREEFRRERPRDLPDDFHYRQIRAALAAGKDVPDRVLAGYADLAAKYGNPEKPPVSEGQLPPKVAAGEGQPPVVPPKPPSETAVVPEAPEPPQQTGPVGISNAARAETRAQIGERINRALEALPPAKRQSGAATMSRAVEAGYDREAYNIARDVNNSRRPMSAEEEAGLGIRYVEAQNEYDSRIREISEAVDRGDAGGAGIARQRANMVLDEIDAIDKALLAGGTEIGRAQQFRQNLINREDYSLAKVTHRVQAAKGSRLTDAEHANIKKAVEEFDAAKKRHDEVMAQREELVAQREREVAARVAEIEARRSAIESKAGRRTESIRKERTDIKNRLKELGFRVNDITGVSAEGAYLVGRLAVSYFKEGAKTLDEVVAKVRADLPELTDRDVWQAMNARDPNVQAKAKKAAQNKYKSLQTEARLLDELEDVVAGVERPAGSRIQAPKSQRIAQLEKRLAALRAKARQTAKEQAEVEALTREIEEAKGGRFVTPEPAKPRPVSPKIKALRDELATLKAQHQKSLRDQARIRVLEVQLKNAERGVFEKRQPLIKPSANPTIRGLKAKINQLRKQAYATIDDPKRLAKALQTLNELQTQGEVYIKSRRKARRADTPELANVKAKIGEVRTLLRIQEETADINQQLESGVVKVHEKPVPKPMPPAIEKAKIELEQAKRKLRNIEADAAPITAKRVGFETINTLRALKATADMSYALRQGLVLSVRRPEAALQSFGRATAAMFSQYKAEQIDQQIRAAPHHYIREKSGLYLAPLDVTKIDAREESFMAKFIEKVPALGSVVRASERHMISGLNLLRTAAFDQFLEAYPNATDAELEAWADWVNVASGRGDLGKLSQAGQNLGYLLFSPRFTFSRVQTPTRIFKHWKQPRVRKEIAKDYAALAGLGATALALASLAGADVTGDPDDPDFGKIKVGDTRVDIWGGLQQPIRLALRIAYGGGRRLWEGDADIDPMDAFYQFASFKLGPLITFPMELYTGKTAVGEEIEPSETLIRAITPLLYQDIYQTFKEEGFGRAAWTTGLGAVGVGVQTYQKKRRVAMPPSRSTGREGRGGGR